MEQNDSAQKTMAFKTSRDDRATRLTGQAEQNGKKIAKNGKKY